MSVKGQNTPEAARSHGRELISFKVGRFFELVHKAHVGSSISVVVVLLLLIVGNFAVFVGFGWAAERAGFPQPACQGVACGLLLLTLVVSFLIMRGMLWRQVMSFPHQGPIPEKPLGWDKPQEKLKSAEKNSRKVISKQGNPPELVPKQTKGKTSKRGNNANRSG
ncbi:hypothetical protein AB0N37_25465 [Streptomyces griseoincarnatus]